MQILFYSTKKFEKSFLDAANSNRISAVFIKDALSLETAEKAKGFDAISIFAGDDASADVLEALYIVGIRFIAIRAAGYDNVNLEKAAEIGINVANVPKYSPYAIAEHAVGMILALNRNIIAADKQVHNQNYSVDNLVGFDLHEKTIGIVGVGTIGSVFVKIMHGFGCRLLGFDKVENTSLKKKYALEYVELPELCSVSNIISIHTCLTAQTKYLINRKLIGQMQPGTMLINSSRGGCVNTADVIAGLEGGQIGYFGADVYENEKGIFFYDHTGNELKDEMLKKLLAMPNVLITPHQAFATKEALSNIAVTTFYNIECWTKGQRSDNELTVTVGLIEEKE